ncbi:MAG: hypothetical protein IJP89_02230 [Synergistaceae bacterium]|nr:hypothetical protein [Synergistaceae bacterium]
MRYKSDYVPPTPEEDAGILRKGLYRALAFMAPGLAVYVAAGVFTVWLLRG